jgi:hypothetical protein
MGIKLIETNDHEPVINLAICSFSALCDLEGMERDTGCLIGIEIAQ